MLLAGFAILGTTEPGFYRGTATGIPRKKGALQNVNMLTVSKSGRSYIPGKPLSSDLRHLIIDKIVEGGGDPLTMIFSGRFVDIANELNVGYSFENLEKLPRDWFS